MNYTLVHINDTTKKVFFDNRLIGELHQSNVSVGWFVKTEWAEYTGFFKTLEKACIELVFKYCDENLVTLPSC